MELIKVWFTLTIAMVLVASNVAALAKDDDDDDKVLLEPDPDATTDSFEFPLPEGQEASSLRGLGRFLVQQNPRVQITCDKFPRICRASRSPGPDCCKKKCVNVFNDRLNCGMCGYKCKYTEICCKGNCVNPSFHRRNCGGCNKKCKKGEFCVYGLCNYA